MDYITEAIAKLDGITSSTNVPTVCDGQMWGDTSTTPETTKIRFENKWWRKEDLEAYFAKGMK